MPLPDWNLEAEEIDDDNDNGDLIMEEDDDMEDEQPLVKFMSHSTKDQRAPSTSKTSRREEWSSYDRSVLKVEMKNEDYAQSSQESSSYNEASSGLYGNTEACHDEESVQYESSEMLAQSSQTQHYPVYSVYRPLNEFTPEHHTFIPTKTQQMCYENAIPQEDDHYIAENVEYHGNIEGFFDQETVDDEGFGDGEYVVDYGYGQQNIAHSSATQYSIVGHTPEGQPIYAMQSPPPQPQPQQPPPNAPPPYREIYRVIRAPQSTVPCQRLQSDDQEAHVFHGAQANSLQHRNIESFQPSETKIIIHNIKNSELSKRSTTAKTQGESVIPRCGSADVPGTSGGGKHKRKQSSDESSVRQSAKITDSAVAAQTGAIQRFSTLEGWKQMATWLKMAKESGDWNRLKLLLSQCAQASLTVELLQSNDTPRFVRKLSKTCIDPDVRKVASDLITNWKNLIANPPPPAAEKPKRVGSAKRKTPHPATKTSSRVSLKVESSTSAELPKVVSGLKLSDGDEKNRETKNKSDEKQQEKTDERTETKLEHKKPDGSTANMEKQDKSVTSDEGAVTKKSSSKLTEFNFTEKLDEERQQKKKRPKTAKTYMSKFRSTGLEGDDESSASGKGAVEAADKKKKPPLSKALLDANRRAAVSSATKSSNTLPTSTVSASSLPAEKKQTATFPRVMMSNTFMDALLDPVLKKNVPKSKRKPSAAVASKTTVSIMPSVMEGLYSDTSSSMGKERNTESSENKDSEPPVIDRDVNPTGKRMIRFADEHGQELVQIRLFEVEEGERINVHRFTSEQMKHMESQRERTFMKEHGSQFGHDTRNDGKIFHPWRLIDVDLDEVALSILRAKGSKCVAATLETERQKTVMQAFSDPFVPADILLEPDSASSSLLPVSVPVTIPLELLYVEETPQDTATPNTSDTFKTNADASTAEPGSAIDVQKLMSQLKEKGLVSTGADLANILNKVPPASALSSVKSPSSVPCIRQASFAVDVPNAPLQAPQLRPPQHTYVQIPTQVALSAAPQLALSCPTGYPPVGLSLATPPSPQVPLLNGPVPAGVTPTVGVDHTQHGPPLPSTSDASHGRAPVPVCTFFLSGNCAYGVRCRFAHGDQPTAGTRKAETRGGFGGRLGRGGPPVRGRGNYGGPDDYRRPVRGRGGRFPSPGRRGYIDRDRDFDRDRRLSFDRDRHERGRERWRRRSRSRSHSRSRSRSRSPHRRFRSPPRRSNKDSLRDRDERLERKLTESANQGASPREADIEEQRMSGLNEKKPQNDQQKSPPEDPVPTRREGETASKMTVPASSTLIRSE